MIETLAVYLIVAVSAVWTLWRLFPRGWINRRVSARPTSGCGGECGCHRG